MKHLIMIMMLLLISTGQNVAQDTVIMPDDLPEPVFATEGNIIFYADPHQFAWLDNETLVFTPFNERTEDWEELAQGYQYDLSTNTLIELESSPFEADMDEETRDWFQVRPEATVHQSPYAIDAGGGGTIRHVMYISRFLGQCFNECSALIVMGGRYFVDAEQNPDFVMSSFIPVHFQYDTDILFWSRDNQSTVIQTGVVYGQGYRLSHINEEGNDVHIRYGLHDNINDRILAMSDDGNYLAFSSHSNDDSLAIGQSLYIWQAPYHDDACSCTYDAQIVDMIAPINQNAPNEILFAGVGFVNENTILYIGESGLMRHNLLTGISTSLDRELNVGWIRTAVFSPDLEHVAITTEEGLYILETFAP